MKGLKKPDSTYYTYLALIYIFFRPLQAWPEQQE